MNFESKSIFVYDKPIGRKEFIFVYFKLLALICLILIPSFITILIWRINIYTRAFFWVSYVLAFLVSAYLAVINYSKRIDDLYDMKRKTPFYVSLYYICSFALNFVPIVRYVIAVINIGIFLFLVFKSGNLYSNGENKLTDENA